MIKVANRSINIIKKLLKKQFKSNKCKIENDDLEERVFYKISKSAQKISNVTYEKNFWNYKIGENIDPTGFGFSFVPKDTILLCVQYGDVLNCLTVPKDVEIKYRGLVFQEHASTKINVLWQKSIKDVETLKYMIKVSSNEIIHMGIMCKASRQLLVDLKFTDTLKLWDEIASLLQYPIKKENFDKIRDICK